MGAAGLPAKNDAPEDRTHFSYFYNSHLSSAERGSILQPLWCILVKAQVFRLQQ